MNSSEMHSHHTCIHFFMANLQYSILHTKSVKSDIAPSYEATGNSTCPASHFRNESQQLPDLGELWVKSDSVTFELQ